MRCGVAVKLQETPAEAPEDLRLHPVCSDSALKDEVHINTGQKACIRVCFFVIVMSGSWFRCGTKMYLSKLAL